MLLGIDDALDQLEESVQQLREALTILSQPGSAEMIFRISTEWVDDRNRAWLAMKAECADNVIEALWIFIEAHDRIFREKGGFAGLCSMAGVNPDLIRDWLRLEMVKPLTEGGLLDVNLFKFREMVNNLVERLHSRGN